MASQSDLAHLEDHVNPGDYLCSFYEDKMEQFQVVLPFLKEGLAKGEKCLYLADENTAAEIKAGLLMHGVDVGSHLKSRQLTVVTKRETYLPRGRFDPNAMVSYLISAVDAALREGYSGFRFAGEAAWMLQDLSSLDDLIEYERMLCKALGSRPVKALSQYNARRFFSNTLMKLLKLHPRVLLGRDLYEAFHEEPASCTDRS